MSQPPRIAVAFLARGADSDWEPSCRRFLDSYTAHPAGTPHSFYVLFKGFEDMESLSRAKAMFAGTEHLEMMLDDDKLDIGAYIEWAGRVDHDQICAFNTHSEILSDDWLRKLAVNLALPDVGLVGATASYESLSSWNDAFPPFPNFHLRSNAFMVDRRTFCSYTDGMKIRDKVDAFHFESGPRSLSAYIAARGQEILIVGRNGRGYSRKFWPASDTFRLGFQRNLLVADNQTRNFLAMPWPEKRVTALRTWGRYLRDFEMPKINPVNPETRSSRS